VTESCLHYHYSVSNSIPCSSNTGTSFSHDLEKTYPLTMRKGVFYKKSLEESVILSHDTLQISILGYLHEHELAP
jgi:hypothetical protein